MCIHHARDARKMSSPRKQCNNQMEAVRLWLLRKGIVCQQAVSSIRQVRKQIGENIRVLRSEAGFSQEKLAEKADLHPVQLGQVERGEKAVSVEAVWKISKALKVDMAKMFRNAGVSLK